MAGHYELRQHLSLWGGFGDGVQSAGTGMIDPPRSALYMGIGALENRSSANVFLEGGAVLAEVVPTASRLGQIARSERPRKFASQCGDRMEMFGQTMTAPPAAGIGGHVGEQRFEVVWF